MSEYLDQIIEDETVTCEVCKKVYKTDEINFRRLKEFSLG